MPVVTRRAKAANERLLAADLFLRSYYKETGHKETGHLNRSSLILMLYVDCFRKMHKEFEEHPSSYYSSKSNKRKSLTKAANVNNIFHISSVNYQMILRYVSWNYQSNFSNMYLVVYVLCKLFFYCLHFHAERRNYVSIVYLF